MSSLPIDTLDLYHSYYNYIHYAVNINNTVEHSFAIIKIIPILQEGAAENVTILLLGNKSDRAERQVKT